jgi:broad specificity phosphatase PhoE
MNATHLYLLRHAPTAWNKNKRFQGWTDVPIDKSSKALCASARESIARLDCSAAYSSPLSRARTTAELVWSGEGDEIQSIDDLKEIYLGDLEGMFWSDAYQEHSELLDQWKIDPGNTRMPHGETLNEVQTRVTLAISEILERHPAERILVVGHGFALLSYLCGVLGIDLKHFRRLWLDPLGLTEVVHSAERSYVRRINQPLGTPATGITSPT